MEGNDPHAPEPELPDGAILEYEIRVYSYLDAEAETAWGWTLTEGVSMTEMIGMLSRLEHFLAHRVENDDFNWGN